MLRVHEAGHSFQSIGNCLFNATMAKTEKYTFTYVHNMQTCTHASMNTNSCVTYTTANAQNIIRKNVRTRTDGRTRHHTTARSPSAMPLGYTWLPRPTKRCDVTWAILMRLVFLSSRGNARSSGGNTTVPLYVGHLSVIWWRWLLLYGSLERRYQLENLPNNVIHLVAWITMWRGKGFKYRTCTLDMTTNIKSYATICN